MGKIFGIADLPVSTILTPFEQIEVPQPPVRELSGSYRVKDNGLLGPSKDVVVSKNLKAKSNPVISMRNGIGKLMSHFSKKRII